MRGEHFSLNAIAISLNPASRGLLLDPTNGLSDIERAEVRALSIHSFTNQAVRLLRLLRFAARMGFKVEQRTQEWFELAIERNLHHSIEPEDAGSELQAVAREERPTVVLKAWEEAKLLEVVNPVLAKKHPDYDAVNRLMKVREDLFTAGFRPRLSTPMLLAILGRLKDREQSGVLAKAGFRTSEAESILTFDEKALATQKEMVGKKMQAPVDAYRFLEKLPLEQVAYLLAESNHSGALSKIRAYLHKWRPIRSGLSQVGNELEALGMARGAKFDQIVEQVFAMQLTGRGKTPEEREKILRKLSGIKEQPKKKEKEKKAGKSVARHAADASSSASQKHAAEKAEAKHAAEAKTAHARSAGRAAPKAHPRHVSAAKKKHHR